eukprot:gnl/TRDRNA2_/TRDRNA2_128511_c0_seq1.p1 gnl/TRDRNA2_/TRDRNA2_128511_c0~~gnl/TRDRNA2_/TRDRNA2_128511_c0_seq1.p1  ORF type:complete len:380 (+),score=77.53 gnl/TRDRNA2_/TRDRNA2_128511_c0_seq1:145-1284(+)
MGTGSSHPEPKGAEEGTDSAQSDAKAESDVPPETSEAPEAPVAPENRLISAGEDLIRKLKDPATDPQELSEVARSAIVRKEFTGMLQARDDRGRTPLHVAATRGDLRLCQEMIKADPTLVNMTDKYRNTPIMDASLIGRVMIVKELLANGAEVTSKNSDCMNALQLSCVNEGAGHGEVIEALVRAGADPHEMCWQVTPMMAAADSGHIWAVQTLIDMGANPAQLNSASMGALDYARDMETAQLLYDVIQGDKLSDKPAPRFDTQKLFKDAEARRARLHRAAKTVALEDAFAALEVPIAWLAPFRESGENFNEIRKKWRHVCLKYHPDKQPEGLEDDEAAEFTGKFQTAMAAFEAIERHFRSVCKDEEQLPDEVRPDNEE